MSVAPDSVSRMEWIATGIAVIAALVAGWQAVEARRSRLDARTSAAEAQQHEERAATAAERIASAVEEQNVRERAEREKYRNPWQMVSSRPDKSTRSYKFMLGGDETLTDVRIMIDDSHTEREKFRFVKPETEAMRPGESMTLSWWRHMGSASQITADVHWTRPNGEQHHAAVTLD